MSKGPKVFLVGAGPGDPELLTIKAQRILGQADVVVYDRLVSPEILAMVAPGTARINVGKQPNSHPFPQPEINDLLVKLAQSGRRNIVRLKGGDPFTFGRGSEEAQVLAAHGIEVEVVPGITAASGCAAALGIPLTHRGLATGVRYLTGHCRDDADLELDWDGLADPDTTLVIYMGKANIAQIAAEIMVRGLAPSMPVAAINSGTTERQSHLFSTLGDIADDIRKAGLEGPVLFVIGRVVTLAAGYYQRREEANVVQALHQAGLA
ncbi:MAG: uroporphyrinogen-III C-methyltransferase [Rhodospirillales bacterium]|nr:uroporphyrinogen-III C-methyltransferase [Rhodospirillales bacterium]